PDSITVQHRDGTKQTHQLHVGMPYNRKTQGTQTPVVQPGQQVGQNQLLAHSNFTDKAGTLALGKNLRVAYLPFKLSNHEDAFVISESAAKKLTSQHAYQHQLDYHDQLKT